MKFTGIFRVPDKETEVIRRNVVLVIDVSVTYAEGELHVEVLAHRHRITVGKARAPEVELLAYVPSKLEVTVSTPSVCSEEMTDQSVLWCVGGTTTLLLLRN